MLPGHEGTTLEKGQSPQNIRAAELFLCWLAEQVTSLPQVRATTVL